MNIAVVNHSTQLDSKSFSLMVQACDYQMRQHVCHAWDWAQSCVYAVPVDTYAHPGDCLIGIFDDADAADALGYHDESPSGKVYGKVFVKVTMEQPGATFLGTLAPVLSHEAIEARGDALCNAWRDMPDGRQVAEELCDMVEEDSYGVEVQGVSVQVSNFALPAWFDDHAPAGSKFDHLGKLHRQFTMSPGGYLIVRKAGVATQVFGELAAPDTQSTAPVYGTWRQATKTHPASRTFKRLKAVAVI